MVKAVGAIFQNTGAIVSCGDSGGILDCETGMKASGIMRICNELGIKMADFDNGREVNRWDNILVKKFYIANGILDSDGVISLPRLKTHSLVRFTGAVKNQFGCVVGKRKSSLHHYIPDPYDFSQMLVDLCMLIRPRLYIMDGITGMADNDPKNGTLVKLGVILLSIDPVALDAVACKIINLNPEIVPTNVLGEKSGLGSYHDVEVLGDSLFIHEDFNVNHLPIQHTNGSFIRKIINREITERLSVNRDKCTMCMSCAKICPLKVINPPYYDYLKCIRCYCCQEVCPSGAIIVKSTLWGNIIKFSKLNNLLLFLEKYYCILREKI
jgi:uncharacterized protein (DUF362 family)